MENYPRPLRALEEERSLLIRCLERLEVTEVAVERADVAFATALLAARYENVLADAFYPQIVDALGMQVAVVHAEKLLAQVRDAVATVRADLRGVSPLDAHLGDPSGLEEDIDSMAASLRSLLRYEEDELFELVELLSPADGDSLRERIDNISAHQTSLPDPPGNSMARKLAEFGENVSLAWNDHATSWHPGIDSIMNEPR